MNVYGAHSIATLVKLSYLNGTKVISTVHILNSSPWITQTQTCKIYRIKLVTTSEHTAEPNTFFFHEKQYIV